MRPAGLVKARRLATSGSLWEPVQFSSTASRVQSAGPAKGTPAVRPVRKARELFLSPPGCRTPRSVIADNAQWRRTCVAIDWP